MTLKFATAKAELNELIETHLLELKVASIGGKKPNINSFSLSVIEDLVQPEFSSKANQWWINEGKLFWRTETHKRNYLYFNPWAIGFLAGWIGTYISFIFFSHLLFTFPVGFAVITAAGFAVGAPLGLVVGTGVAGVGTPQVSKSATDSCTFSSF